MTLDANSLEHTVELLDRAFNEGDLDAVLSFYEDAAVVVTEPSRLARGCSELREFFESTIKSGLLAKQIKTRVIEADGVALFLSRWTLTSSESNVEMAPRAFFATTVFRKQPDGIWKALIDNPFGPLVLDAE
ncbi:MAG: nuclear transport factor 2 family protein [Terracidiphilus sp.]